MNSTGTASHPAEVSPPPTSSVSQRSHGLDALRGAAILAMVLSAAIPWGPLPAWMYHAQNPPPTHALNTAIAGITWVDLVFPFFLFAMGAAFPLALNRRLNSGRSKKSIVGDILSRGILLGFFAILHQHVMPTVIAPSGTRQATVSLFGWSTTLEKGALYASITGFLLMFAIFMPFRKQWKPWMNWSLRGVGWFGVILLLSLLVYPSEARPGFSLYRSNIILIVLTNMAVFGSLIWLATRGRVLPLLGVMGVMLAMRFGAQEPGWVQTVWRWVPGLPLPFTEGGFSFGWIYHMRYLQYLLVVIPGVIAGDLLWRWMQLPVRMDPEEAAWSRGRWTAIAGLLFVLTIAVLIGLQERWLWQANALTAILGAAGWLLMRRPAGAVEDFLRQLFYWGMFWLILGLVFEPYEGGIKKSPATISYYFVSAGLACFLMAGFTIIIDVLKKQRGLQLLIDNGQNPMIAYVGSGLFIVPVLTLISVHEQLQEWMPGPWMGTLRGILYTLLLALAVQFLTRRRIFWRT
jgi:predicted acyltransferase